MKRTTMYRLMLAVLLVNPLMTLPMENIEPDNAGAQQAPDAAQNNVQNDVQECPICFGDSSEADFSGIRRLTCGHEYCRNCLTERIDLGLREWQELDRHVHCPREGCAHIMNAEDIRIVTGDDARIANFNNILTDRFINANPNYRRCPTPRCEVIYEFDRVVHTIQCRECHQEYCSDCRLPHAQGEACNQPVIQNNNNDANARADQEWLLQNTRPCPNCRANIQKNGGCNHMTCRACRHEFCWYHLIPWGDACRQNHWFEGQGDQQALEAAAVQAAARLRADQQAAPAAPRPGMHAVEMDPDVFALLFPGRRMEDVTPEDIERRFAQLDQNPNNPVIHNQPVHNAPDARGVRFRAVPRQKNPPYLLIALGVAAASAVTYGCYKLYQYLTTPKANIKKDMKEALADLHKEVIRQKTRAITNVYVAGTINAYFDAQVKAGSFETLGVEQMTELSARVNAMEAVCTNQGAIEDEYAVFTRFVAQLLSPANPAVEVRTPEVVVPAPAPEVAVKKIAVKKPVVKKPVKRIVRNKRVRTAHKAK